MRERIRRHLRLSLISLLALVGGVALAARAEVDVAPPLPPAPPLLAGAMPEGPAAAMATAVFSAG